ncbi:MAG: PrsW family intramembrane metalloprotease [Candidatus Aegiribacteria sp.]|nr:PrsW family intramembrane metalloprotease [Candidatus Aegiribacteria sp.]
MNLVISLTLAIVPALIIVIYFYRKDRAKPEPKKIIIRIFLLGLLSTVPAIFIELSINELRHFLNPYYKLLYPIFKAFIIAGLVEESLKLFIVKKYAFQRKCFDEVMDGIVYTVVAGMGFACLENVLYVMGRGITVGILRAFTSIPMHASVSVIMGYWIGMAKFSKSRGSRRKLILKGFLLAVLFHGLYDLCIFAIPGWSELMVLGLLPVLIWAILLAKRKIQAALKEDEKAGRIPQTC